MILEWFVEMVVGLVGAVADWLPEFTLPAGSSGALGYALSVNAVFPVTELLAVGSMWLSVFVFLFVYRVVKILIAFIPGVGGAGA